MYNAIVALHGLAGLIGLITFWTSGFARKGSRLHIRSGKIYFTAIAIVVASGFPLAGTRFLTGQLVAGAFLSYLLVITMTSAWVAWRAVRDKANWHAFVGPVYQALMWLNLICGVAMLYIGIAYGENMRIIISGYAAIGIFLFFNMRKFAKTEPTDSRWWLREHLGSNLGNGIATHIAFLSIGLPRMFPQLATQGFQTFAWFGPIVIAAIAGVWLFRKYASPSRPRTHLRHEVTTK